MVHARRGAVSQILSVDEGGVRVAGVLLNHFPGAAAGGDIVRRAESGVVGRGDGEIACFEGPVPVGTDKPNLLRALLEQVDEVAARLGVWRIRFAGGRSWPIGATTLPSRRCSRNSVIAASPG